MIKRIQILLFLISAHILDLEQSSHSEMSRADKEILLGQTSLFLLSMSSVWEMPNTSNLFAD